MSSRSTLRSVKYLPSWSGGAAGWVGIGEEVVSK